MDGKKFVAGYIAGLFVLPIEIILFAGSLFVSLIAGNFPESASAMASMLSTAATANLIINLVVGILGALNLGGMRDVAFGFLGGVLTAIACFGGILSIVAPQIVAGLWGEFLTVLSPIVIVIFIALSYEFLREKQGYAGR